MKPRDNSRRLRKLPEWFLANELHSISKIDFLARISKIDFLSPQLLAACLAFLDGETEIFEDPEPFKHIITLCQGNLWFHEKKVRPPLKSICSPHDFERSALLIDLADGPNEVSKLSVSLTSTMLSVEYRFNLQIDNIGPERLRIAHTSDPRSDSNDSIE
jgi:hypothetical protein